MGQGPSGLKNSPVLRFNSQSCAGFSHPAFAIFDRLMGLSWFKESLSVRCGDSESLTRHCYERLQENDIPEPCIICKNKQASLRVQSGNMGRSSRCEEET